jgi:hypothetical protein
VNMQKHTLERSLRVNAFSSGSEILPFHCESQNLNCWEWDGRRGFLMVQLPRPNQRIDALSECRYSENAREGARENNATLDFLPIAFRTLEHHETADRLR